MNNIPKFVARLHTHVRSLFDAFIEPEALAKRIKELGGRGCAITDHGSLTAIEDFRRVFDTEDLKLIPGCELYVDGGILGRMHLIVLAVNDHGYKGIGKIVTKANKNLVNTFPVITKDDLFEIMKDYKGDIIATSACMQGVISSIFLMNSIVENKISKIREKQSKYMSPSDDKYARAQSSVEMAESKLDVALIARDECKRIAEQKFTAREKAVTKLISSGASDAKEKNEELERDKIASKKAIAELSDKKEAVEVAKKELSAAKKSLKSADESVDKYLSYESEINELSKELKSEENLFALALKVAKEYDNCFGHNNFFAEIQYHGIKEEAYCFPKVVKVAKELNIPLVAANDEHILTNSKEDRLRRCIIRSLRFKDDFEKENIGDSELYLKDNEELFNSISQIIDEKDVIEALNNIEVIFNRCNVEFKTEKHYPKFSKKFDANKLLEEEVKEGIKWRFPNGFPDERYEKRLNYELDIIEKMGYADYHLVVKDFLEYGRLLGFVPKEKISEAPLTIFELKEWINKNGWKNEGLRIGPGRGSAVGSLVCFILGITALDPIKYNLLFERFLNPERVSMPDIDSDISNSSRQKVIEYVQNRYGEMAVCGILTTTYQGPKGSIKIAGKYYGYFKYENPLTSLGEQLAKDVPSDVGTKFSTLVDKNGACTSDGSGTCLYDYLVQKYNKNKDALEILSWAKAIEGTFTAYSAHAAGIVISDNEDVSDYIPLRANEQLGLMTTQCDMVQVEENGLLKFDFLGLKTLDIITECLFAIEKKTGKIVKPLDIDLEDKRVYKEILAAGKTNAVFQFESNGMKQMLRRFKPECFEDLIILVSMFRPGPLQYLDGVIDVKNGVKPMTFLCPELEPILGKTYGAIVYQEQVMQIFQDLAGYTLGGADMVRRFMSKKKADKLAHEKEAFISGDISRGIDGCVKRGISKEVAEELFNQMMDFAAYAFNKSHAAAYSFNAFITAYLKCYYPAEFFMAALNWADKIEKISGLMYEAANCGVKVLAPDVNLSDREFTVVDNNIRFGLSAIKGVSSSADDIISERSKKPFSSFMDFLVRLRLDSTTVNNLISAGAFDSFSNNRAAMKDMYLEVKDLTKKQREKLSFIASVEALLPVVETLKDNNEVIAYQEDRGLKAEIKEVTTSGKLEKRLENAKNTLVNINKNLSLCRLKDIKEDNSKRMAEEKEFLGMYVTKHPMDYYPEAKDVNVKNIIEITTGDYKAYGVISDLQIRNRKSDGAKMAFFKLEDKSGSIDVCVFTKAYSQFGDKLTEGKVVLLTGKVDEEEREIGEDIELVYKFIANSYDEVAEKKSSIMIFGL